MCDRDNPIPPSCSLSLPRLKFFTFIQLRRFQTLVHLGSVIPLHADLCVSLRFCVLSCIAEVQSCLRDRQRQAGTSFTRATLLLNDRGPQGPQYRYSGSMTIQLHPSVQCGPLYHGMPFFGDALSPRREQNATQLVGLYEERNPPPVLQRMMTLLQIAGIRSITVLTFCIRISNLPYHTSDLFPYFDQLTQLTFLRLVGTKAMETAVDFIIQCGHDPDSQIPLPLLQHIVLGIDTQDHHTFLTITSDEILNALKTREAAGGKRLRVLTLHQAKQDLTSDMIEDIADRVAHAGISESYVLR